MALKKKPWLLVLLPMMLLSLFGYCLWYAKSAEVIHANWAISGVVGGCAALLSGVPVVCTLRGDDVTRAQRSMIDRMILRCCVRLSRKLVTVSQAIMDQVGQLIPARQGDLVLIENGVGEEFLQLTHTPAQGLDGQLHLLSIGSLIERKGMDILLQALAHPELGEGITLTIAGDGPEMPSLQDMSRSIGLTERVAFVGKVEPSRTVQLFAGADVFVLASHSEGRPNVIIEAMAAGLPVLASNIEGVNELVHDQETGLLFPDNDAASLAHCILILEKDDEKRLSLGEQGRASIRAMGLTWSRTAQRYRQVFQDVIQAGRSCAVS